LFRISEKQTFIRKGERGTDPRGKKGLGGGHNTAGFKEITATPSRTSNAKNQKGKRPRKVYDRKDAKKESRHFWGKTPVKGENQPCIMSS